MEIKEKAFAKINLSLDVVRRLENGWHEMCMVMQSISLCDDVSIKAVPGTGEITIKTNRSYIPDDERNIGYKAAERFLKETGIAGFDVDINIVKRIPVCAGLGGGSSDGAAVLRAMNKIFDTKLGLKELEQLGAKLGSDVPFCVAGGTALATGTGTDLEDVAAIPECSVLVCKPSFSVSTPELFSQIDCGKIRCRPDTKGMLTALEEGDLKGVGMRVFNVFEDVLAHGKEKVADIKSVMYDKKAIGACMTGTGSAVFGLFLTEGDARDAFNALKQEYRECHICKTTAKLE